MVVVVTDEPDGAPAMDETDDLYTGPAATRHGRRVAIAAVVAAAVVAAAVVMLTTRNRGGSRVLVRRDVPPGQRCPVPPATPRQSRSRPG
jgi:hypothetical protein